MRVFFITLCVAFTFGVQAQSQDASKFFDKTKYFGEKCISMGLKGGTPEFVQCVVQLRNIVPFDDAMANQMREKRSQQEAEQLSKERESQAAILSEMRRLYEADLLRREAENSQAQAALLNELRRQQGADQLNSLTRNLLEMGRPQMLAPNNMQFPQTTNCTSRYNRIGNTVQTTCD
jgi:hypothetical protein